MVVVVVGYIRNTYIKLLTMLTSHCTVCTMYDFHDFTDTSPLEVCVSKIVKIEHSETMCVYVCKSKLL